jgi:hypothetical protein
MFRSYGSGRRDWKSRRRGNGGAAGDSIIWAAVKSMRFCRYRSSSLSASEKDAAPNPASTIPSTTPQLHHNSLPPPPPLPPLLRFLSSIHSLLVPIIPLPEPPPATRIYFHPARQSCDLSSTEQRLAPPATIHHDSGYCRRLWLHN